MKQLYYIFIVILGVLIMGCDATTSLPSYQLQNPATMQEIKQFANTIEQIGNEVDRLDQPDDLFELKMFQIIYENPSVYLASAIALIEREDVKPYHKKIIGYSMQRLPPEQFVGFVSLIVKTVEQGKTSLDILETTAFTLLNWGRQTLIMYYQDPSVQALLNRILNLSNLSVTRKKYIQENILTGKAKQDYLNYMDELGRKIE